MPQDTSARARLRIEGGSMVRDIASNVSEVVDASGTRHPLAQAHGQAAANCHQNLDNPADEI